MKFPWETAFDSYGLLAGEPTVKPGCRNCELGGHPGWCGCAPGHADLNDGVAPVIEPTQEHLELAMLLRDRILLRRSACYGQIQMTNQQAEELARNQAQTLILRYRMEPTK